MRDDREAFDHDPSSTVYQHLRERLPPISCWLSDLIYLLAGFPQRFHPVKGERGKVTRMEQFPTRALEEVGLCGWLPHGPFRPDYQE
jgi:hypothetical protein